MKAKLHAQRRNALEDQPASATVWKSSVMEGTAVATMDMSRPMKVRTMAQQSMISQKRVPVGVGRFVLGSHDAR